MAMRRPRRLPTALIIFMRFITEILIKDSFFFVMMRSTRWAPNHGQWIEPGHSTSAEPLKSQIPSGFMKNLLKIRFIEAVLPIMFTSIFLMAAQLRQRQTLPVFYSAKSKSIWRLLPNRLGGEIQNESLLLRGIMAGFRLLTIFLKTFCPLAPM